MKIRDANISDAATLDSLLMRLIRCEKRWDNNINESFVAKDNYINMIDKAGCKLAVAEENGEIIGYAYGFIYAPPTLAKPIAILDALYVCENHRNKGCASVLIGEFVRFAVSEGAVSVELKVISDNEAENKLYSRIGFKEVKRYMRLEP